MEVSKKIDFLNYGERTTWFQEPEECPICKKAIKPQELAARGYKGSAGKLFLGIMYLCKSCYHSFIAFHDASDSYATILYLEPNRYAERQFDAQIKDLSPQFVKIYNQALAAESAKMDEIAGMGYRKALEFLIKDYLIHLDPADMDTIRRMELGNCIANKVSNDKIKTVASRSAWIGNDQTHYVQRFEDRDIKDLKQFIDACVYWISMELITEDALSMEKKDR